MNKLSMRARKLDNSKELRVFRVEEIPDLEEQGPYGRSVIQIATGVEKEEEEEHHLQAVISAALADAPGAKDISIPVPDASVKVDHYAAVYTQTFQFPKTLIRSTADTEWNDDYDLDEEDAEWLQKLNKPTRKLTDEQFESVITQFEKLAREVKEIPETPDAFGPVSTQASAAVLADLFRFWKSKREPLKCGTLLYPLKPETLQNDPDPYVCFRRRELRPLRKGRRNDQQSYDKMMKLKVEMERARGILELVKKRDRLKKESLSLDFLIFEQKATIWDLRRRFQIPATSEMDNQATELKKPPKLKPKLPPAPQSKIRLNINGGIVRTVSSEPTGGALEDNVIRMTTSHLNPTANDEQELGDPRFLERQLAGIDPLQARLPELDAPVVDPMAGFYARRPASDYEDLTFVTSFGLTLPGKRTWEAFDIPGAAVHASSSHPTLARGRPRYGRGGRVFFDRSSRAFAAALTNGGAAPGEHPHKRPHFEASDSEEDELDLESEASRSVISVPLPFYTLNELSLLNGTLYPRRPPVPVRRLDVSPGMAGQGPYQGGAGAGLGAGPVAATGLAPNPGTPVGPGTVPPGIRGPQFSPVFRPPPPRAQVPQQS